MSLGKRPRGPMRRTTSMTEITFDLSSGVDAPTVKSNSKDSQKMGLENSTRKHTDGFDTRYLSLVSPRNHPRRNSMDFLETPPFLRACSLCKRRLGTGRDIYMYRGESAFCSLECRQQQMNQDERKDKCSLTSMKKEVASSTASETTSNGDRVAAAS
ncbi:senescence-associated family protein [Cinnamomum micranthum f. kanehirae]|uniref:Senescence-associated family protein n=1 Tax=Cinnamomum micranthum f. kanehirae TaxID=337451 RepID=A0A3S3ML72_9MAGN|nr:senescence-associated family protein [Cinnamomum micranthum f. kanehirae]